MSARTALRPSHTAETARTTDFTGTSQLLRLYSRRDRLVLPVWTYLLGAMVPITAESIKKLYTTQQALTDFAAATNANTSLLAMYGPVFGTSLGSVGTWKAQMMYPMIGLATLLTVIRHTRTEEESGRAELVGATRIGRYAGLAAALLLAGFGSVVAGIICAVGLVALKLPATGSIAFGAALAASGLAWAAVAGVAAQLSASARTARGLALAALATTFVLRAVGDARGDALSWLSPQSWCQQIRPYAGDRWWVLAPLSALTAVGMTVAFGLRFRRDIGTGLLAERLGSPVAGRGLAGPFGLAWRQQRGTMIAWTIGLGLYSMLIGGATKGVGGFLGNGRAVRNAVTRLGGGHQLEQAFLVISFTMLGMAAAGYAISATMRLHEEEAGGRAEAVLAGAVGRMRWACSQLAFAVLGPAIALLIGGILAGLIYGAAVGDIGTQLPSVLGAALVQLPAVWLMSAITMAIFGLLPRFTAVAWGVFCGFIALYIFASLGTGPQWLLDLVPFTHTPKLPVERFHPEPVLWLSALSIGLYGVGLAALRRRDLRG